MHASIYTSASVAKSEVSGPLEVKPVIKKCSVNQNSVDPSSRSSYMCRKCRAHGQLHPVKRHKRNCRFRTCNCTVCYLVNYGRQIVAKQIALYRDQKSSGGNGNSGAASAKSNNTSAVNSNQSNSNGGDHALLSGGHYPLHQHQLPPPLMTMDGGLVDQHSPTEDHQFQQQHGHHSHHAYHQLQQQDTKSEGLSAGFQLYANGGNEGVVGELTDDGPNCRRCRNHGKNVPWKGHKKKCRNRDCICSQCILITMRKTNEKNLREIVQDALDDRQNNQMTSTTLPEPLLPPPLASQAPSIYTSSPAVPVAQSMTGSCNVPIQNTISNDTSSALRSLPWSNPMYRTTIHGWDNRIPTEGQAMSYGNPYNPSMLMMPTHFPTVSEHANPSPWSGYF